MKRNSWFLGAAVLGLAFTLAFPMHSKAFNEGKIDWNKRDYANDKEAFISIGKPTDILFESRSAGSDISGVEAYIDYADEYAQYFEVPSDWEYSGMLELYLVVSGDFQEGDMLKFNVPDATAYRFVNEHYVDPNWEFEVRSDSFCIKCNQRSNGTKVAIKSDVQGAIEGGLESLMGQLRAAAGVSGNTVVKYYGDFSLPYEAMKILKDHPNITLRYTMTANNERNTFVIGGSNVIADPAIPWYGPEYLKQHYGANVVAASGNATSGQYLIVKGDTLTKIAAKLNTSVEALAAKNGIKDVNYIVAGTTLNY